MEVSTDKSLADWKNLAIKLCQPFFVRRSAHLLTHLLLAWYLPPSWLPSSRDQPETIVEAATIASQAARSNKGRNINYSAIPLLLHQTWKNRRADTWPEDLCVAVEKWLNHVISDDMAYFFWEDNGIDRMMAQFEPKFMKHFTALPSNVERADVFRILVLKWFGGIVSAFILKGRSITVN